MSLTPNYTKKSLHSRMGEAYFQFTTNDSSAVNQDTVSGRGVASVARSGTGVFVVTMKERWKKTWLAVAHSLRVGWGVWVSAVDEAAGTITITITDDVTDPDAAADDGGTPMVIRGKLEFDNSNQNAL